MRIHHLNCITACPLGGGLMDGMSKASLRGRMTSHCLLLELPSSLVLVDTGHGFPRAADLIDELERFSPEQERR